jgi:serpin B
MHAFEPARMEINQWVADQTKQRITDLLPEGFVDEQTRLVLVNALYFYGSWKQSFAPGATSQAPFHTLGGETREVATMHAERRYDYAAGADYALAELPYEGDKLRMTIVLPAEGKFESVRSQMSGEWLANATSSLESKTLRLALPKFTLTVGSFDLKQALEAMGMQNVFSTKADFSGICTTQSLRVSQVVQKAFVAVDENGTEAAAATAVGVAGTSAPTEVVPFTVDRPFLFFIRDANGIVLFSGQVVDPTAK